MVWTGKRKNRKWFNGFDRLGDEELDKLFWLIRKAEIYITREMGGTFHFVDRKFMDDLLDEKRQRDGLMDKPTGFFQRFKEWIAR